MAPITRGAPRAPNHRWLTVTAVAVAVAASGTVAPATAAVPTDTTALREAVTIEGITDHLEAFQEAAESGENYNRASGDPLGGYEASAQYVEQQLIAAGYTPVRQ